MDEDKEYFQQFKGFKSLMFAVEHKMSEDYVINCLKTIELEKLLKDLENTEKKIEEIEEIEKFITKKE